MFNFKKGKDNMQANIDAYQARVDTYAKEIYEAVINDGDVQQAIWRLSGIDISLAFKSIFLAQQKIFKSMQTLIQDISNDRHNTTN